MPEDRFVCEDAPDLTIPLNTPVPAKLVDLRSDSYEWDGRVIHKLLWFFEVQDPAYRDSDGRARIVRGQTGTRLTNRPGNKFREWAESLLGRSIPVNFTLTREDLIGLSCQITVSHEKDRKNPEVVWDRIEYVMPAAGFDQPPF